VTLLNAAGLPQFNATISGGPANPAGLIQQALQLDGSNDQVQIPALNLNSNTLTFTAWVKRTGDQADWSGIIFSRAGNTCAGLVVGENNDLHYHWDGDFWYLSTGLALPDNQWALAALVVEPEQATLYLGSGGSLSFWVNRTWHNPEEFDGSTMIGLDAYSSSRRFKGGIDDVGIWNRALSPVEIRAIYDAGLGGASFANTIVPEATAVNVPEDGTAPLRIKLGQQPAGDVTVAVARASGCGTITVQSGASLVFTAANWSTYQTVTLASGVDPNCANDQAIIRCSAPGLINADVVATQQDNSAGDFDEDHDVDLEDFGHLQMCLTGFGVAVSDPACLDADLDGNTWIDQSDITAFIRFFNGPNRPPKTP
jgi:hypothetical protein